MKVRKVVGFLLALSFLCGAFLSTGHELFAKAEEIDQADQSFIEFISAGSSFANIFLPSLPQKPYCFSADGSPVKRIF